MSKYFQHQTSLLESSAIPQVLHLQTELGSKAQTKLEMMLDEMELMKFHEILLFENLLKLDDHLEFQYDISQEMDKLQKKVSLLQKLFEIPHSIFDSKTQKPPYTEIHTFDAIAAAKGLKSGRRFPESENKPGLSSPAQACLSTRSIS